jgi:hypothetical protein
MAWSPDPEALRGRVAVVAGAEEVRKPGRQASPDDYR